MPRSDAGLRTSLWLIRLASLLVPRSRRREWLAQWHAELHHRARQPAASRRAALGRWSVGAFRHGWSVFREGLEMDSLLQDFRFAWRSMRTGRGLVAVAVLSVGLASGP